MPCRNARHAASRRFSSQAARGWLQPPLRFGDGVAERRWYPVPARALSRTTIWRCSQPPRVWPKLPSQWTVRPPRGRRVVAREAARARRPSSAAARWATVRPAPTKRPGGSRISTGPSCVQRVFDSWLMPRLQERDVCCRWSFRARSGVALRRPTRRSVRVRSGVLGGRAAGARARR